MDELKGASSHLSEDM